jgi:ComF family protein
MWKKFSDIFQNLLDVIAPKRKDFAVVSKIDEKTLSEIGRAPEVDGADWIHPLFPYRDNRIRAIIWELKYKENTVPLEIIGRRLYEEIIALVSDIALFDTDAEFLLIPIPISPQRRSERGYNQSEYIVKAVLENDLAHTLLYAPQWFSKIKETQSQSHSQSRQERMENLVGCFLADPRVENKYIILIDDVVTTGSTLSEARHTLLSADARDVFAFTIAH